MAKMVDPDNHLLWRMNLLRLSGSHSGFRSAASGNLTGPWWAAIMLAPRPENLQTVSEKDPRRTPNTGAACPAGSPKLPDGIPQVFDSGHRVNCTRRINSTAAVSHDAER
jgi:hypothetical protein